MFSVLLALIYVAFISLGLPDSLFGSAWPVMVGELSLPVSYAGIVTTVISAGTVVSSLLSDKLTRRLGAGLVTAISVGMTALALLGFALSDSFWAICVLAVPYGLGAGAVDAALNNYVALHYASRHMNWLHCFWGVGATLGPYIMGWAISADMGWRSGYGIVSAVQLVLTAVLFATLPLWKKGRVSEETSKTKEATLGLRSALKIRGVKAILLAFFCYCAFESTAGIWASTYLVKYRAVDAATAAAFASLFYLGITLGRFVSGFVADRAGDRKMIRIGCGVMLTGVLLIILPAGTPVLSLAGLVLAGFGAAPVYPCIIHLTPINFGKENSHAIVGIQMASAYCGSTLIPPLFGIIAQYVGIYLYPAYMLIFVAFLLLMTERVNALCRKPH